MNFDYSDEQQQLKMEARRFLSERCPTSRVRELLDSPGESCDRTLWTGIAELGWHGTTIPEAYGGLGLGYVELCAIAEELGRAVAPVPFASTLYFFAEALLLAGTTEQCARWLPRVARGELVGCMAISEGPGAPARERIATRVKLGRVTGTKLPVSDGCTADVAVVLAIENGLPGMYLVELTAGGVERTALQSVDGSRDIARLDFAGAPAERLGAAGDGLALLDRIFDRAAALLAFEQLGGADRCLEMARDHALARYAFGRPIGSFQAIKHRLSDMYVKNELARSNAYYAAWALEHDRAELALAAATARVASSDAFGFAARECIQIHGGIGVTWEADPHLYYRRAQHLSLVAGAPAWWSERLVTELVRVRAAAQIATTGEG